MIQCLMLLKQRLKNLDTSPVMERKKTRVERQLKLLQLGNFNEGTDWARRRNEMGGSDGDCTGGMSEGLSGHIH